jgi:hypothetical protein
MAREGRACLGSWPVMSGKTPWNLGKESDKLGNLKIRRSLDMSDWVPNMSDKPLWNPVKGPDKSGQGLSS